MLLTVLAIAPGLAICFYFFYKDAHNPEPASYLLTSFLLGMAAVLPAGFIELGIFQSAAHSIPAALFTAYFVVGLVEEGCKFLVLRTYAFSRPSFDEPLDGIVYSVLISMGFATLENAGYAWRHGFEVAFLRMFTSVPAHASFAVVMGYFIGKAKFDTAHRTRFFCYALGGAAAVHGTYDAFLLLSENHTLTQYVSEVLLFSGALLSLLLAVYLSRRMLRLHYRTSERLFQLTPEWTVRHAGLPNLHLIHNLVEQALTDAAKGTTGEEQVVFMDQHWKTPARLRQSWHRGHRFMVIYNAGVPVGFIGYERRQPEMFRVLHLFVLVRHRCRGTGRYLLQQAEADMAEAGAVAIQLCVNEGNPARIFFEKQGFCSNQQTNMTTGAPSFCFLEKVLRPERFLNDGSIPLPVLF